MTLLSRFVIALYFLFLGYWSFRWIGCLPSHIDASLYAYPDHWVNMEAFRQGFLPLWNPYIACGTPHLANWQSACFYPPFWLFNVTGLSNGFMGMAMAHAAWGFAGCYFWLRRQNAGPLACALGALSFAGSAHLTLCWVNLPFIATASWIPWIFWGFHRALAKPRFQNWLWAGLFLSLQVLAGYPFFTFYTVLFLLIWSLAQKPSPQIHFAFGMTLTGAALLTALQWLPFLDLLTYAKPDKWTEYPYFDRPLDYLTLFKPDALGLLGSASYQGPFSNGIFNLYFGLVPLGILVLNVLRIRRLEKNFWAFAALAWLLWMAGPHFPLWRLLPLGLLQWLEPSKAAGLFLFCAVTAAVLTFQSFLRKKPFFPFKPALVFLLSVAWALDLFRVPSLLLHPIADPYQQPDLQEAWDMNKTVLGGDYRFLSLRPKGEEDFTGSLQQALEHQAKQAVENYQANSNAVWGFRSADRYLFLQVDGSENLVRYYNKGFPYKGDLLDVAGVRTFLLPQPIRSIKYERVGKIGDAFLSQDAEASVRLRGVENSVALPSRAAVLDVLAEPGSSWRQDVYLEKRPDGSFVSFPPVSRSLSKITYPYKGGWNSEYPSAGRALCVHNDLLPYDKGYVVFNETYAPGWHAWVDWKPVPILRAYGLFMAVTVETDVQELEFRYEPASFRLGLFLTLMALACGGGLYLKSFLGNRA